MKFLLSALLVIGLMSGARSGEKKDRPLDQDFLIEVATCNNAEIQVGKLAGNRSPSAQVKDFAAKLVKDHHDAGSKLADLLKDRKLAIAAGFDKETKEEVSRLGQLEGNAFDRAFLESIVKTHQAAITMFEHQARNGREADIRAYAKEMLPHLRDHLSRAKELAKSVR